MKSDKSRTARKARAEPAKTVDEYIASLPREARTTLQSLRRTIRATAPDAEERISYQIPAYMYHRPLVFFGAFESHLSFFIVNKEILKTFSKELEPYSTSGTTIHFTPENPLPAALVKRIVKARIKQNERRALLRGPKARKASRT